MDSTILLFALVVLGVPLALFVWLIVRSVNAKQRIEGLSWRLSEVETEMIRWKREKASPVPFAAKPKAESAQEPERQMPVPVPPPVPASPPPTRTVPLPAFTPAQRMVTAEPPQAPPPPPRQPEQEAVSEGAPEIAPAINWEQFMGVKGFAWLGGFALFLGVAFFIKYSFDNNLVPPELRVAIGFLTGLGLLIGGVVMSRRNFPALSQTLCATGVVILYAVTFACRALYHFEFFGEIPTFLLMMLITVTAFLLAVRLDALVVAILGMLGGFLTPVLLSTGQDNPLGLFGYVAVLDAGLMLVALNRRWHFLIALGAFGTALMQIGWTGEFFVREKYFEGNKVLVAMAALLGFNLLWLACTKLAKRRGQLNGWLSGSALGLVAVTLMLTGSFLDYTALGQRPWLIFSFVMLVDLIAIGHTWLDRKLSLAQPISGFAVFVLLGCWTTKYLSNDLLSPGLVFYFLFAVLHSALPVLLQRRQGVTKHGWVSHLFPIVALALVLVPVFQLKEVSYVVWPFILLVDLLAIVLAVLTTMLLPVLAVLLLTLAATGALIFKIPADLTGLPISIFLIGAFVVFFVMASVWLVRRFKPEALFQGLDFGGDAEEPGDVASVLPACSVVLPFLLLIMATLRLPLVNPSPVFGLGLLLVVLLLGITKLFSLDWMPVIGLLGLTALECVWHFHHFDTANTSQPLNLVLGWYLIFYAVFALFPFLFLRTFAVRVVPWASAALAAVPQFFLIHRFVSAVYPNAFMGLLPAVFAIPGLAGLMVILKRVPPENPARMAQIAWFGGMALSFITLIFPIQFDREWITIGWALEGAALLWLLHRVPHPGLRLTGVGLLLVAFVRLALNPAVLEYHARATTPVFNWYLYAYGMVTVCLFIGAKLLAPPRNTIWGCNVPPVLATLGAVLAFLWLNIEIADYFSAPGTTLTFDFSGNFGRDMTYSIAWALFALGLLVYGIWQKNRGARYSAMGLLCVTLLKLFFHDLAQLGELYRIGAFIGVAVVAMVASFAYQKFFSAVETGKEANDEKTI